MPEHIEHYDKTVEERQNSVQSMINAYPGRCCLYIERMPTCKTVDDITKKKYLVPNTLETDQLIYLIRGRLKLKKEDALFLYINKRMLSGQRPIGDLYKKYKSEDDFLYIKYASENCFG